MSYKTSSVEGTLLITDADGEAARSLKCVLDILRHSHISGRVVLGVEATITDRDDAADPKFGRYRVDLHLDGEPSHDIVGVYEIDNPMDPMPQSWRARLWLQDSGFGNVSWPELERIDSPKLNKVNQALGYLFAFLCVLCLLSVEYRAQQAWGTNDSMLLSFAVILLIGLGCVWNHLISRGKSKMASATLFFGIAFFFLFLTWFTSPQHVVSRDESNMNNYIRDIALIKSSQSGNTGNWAERVTILVEKRNQALKIELEAALLERDIDRIEKREEPIFASLLDLDYLGVGVACFAIYFGMAEAIEYGKMARQRT